MGLDTKTYQWSSFGLQGKEAKKRPFLKGRDFPRVDQEDGDLVGSLSGI